LWPLARRSASLSRQRANSGHKASERASCRCRAGSYSTSNRRTTGLACCGAAHQSYRSKRSRCEISLVFPCGRWLPDEDKLQTAGWAKYSHEQYGLPAWGSSGPYKKVYEKFGITGDSTFPFHAWSPARISPFHRHCSCRKESS